MSHTKTEITAYLMIGNGSCNKANVDGITPISTNWWCTWAFLLQKWFGALIISVTINVYKCNKMYNTYIINIQKIIDKLLLYIVYEVLIISTLCII